MVATNSRWIDQMGNVHGRVEGINPSGKALLIGSHLVKQFTLRVIEIVFA